MSVGLSSLADCGHMDRQRIQEMHFDLSVCEGLLSHIALAGQCCAQSLQRTQFGPAMDFRVMPLYLLNEGLSCGNGGKLVTTKEY